MEISIIEFLANAVSTVTILSCLFLKVPQILNIREKKSAEGIYVQTMLMEVTGFTIMTLYNYTNNYSLKTYLEYPFILLQVYVMLYHVLKYQKLLKEPILPVMVIIYIAIVAGFILGMLPKDILDYLVPFCTPLSGFAKVSYIYGMIKAENSDSISITTWIISVSTNLARAFTIYVDSADFKLLMNFIISSFLSLSVLSTAIYYQFKPVRTPIRRKSSYRRRSYMHDD